MIECLSGCIRVFLLTVCAWVGQAATSWCNAGARSYCSSLTTGDFKIRLGQFLCSIYVDDFVIVYKGEIQVHGKRIVTSDVRVSNGVIHVIDDVMMPELDSPLLNRNCDERSSITIRVTRHELSLEYYFISFLSAACCTGRVRSLTPVHTLSKKSNIRPRFPPRSLRLLPPIRLRNTKLSPIKRQILDCGEKICCASIALVHFNLWFYLL